MKSKLHYAILSFHTFLFFISHSIAQDVDTQWKKLYLPVAAGSVAALTVIGLSIICAMKRKKKKSNRDKDEKAEQNPFGM